MMKTFSILTQISICLASSGPKIVAEVDHDSQENADLKSCVSETTEHFVLQKGDSSARMPLSSSQIFQLCLASSGSKITDESDQEVLDPFINNFDPTITPLPGQGIHSSVVASSTATPRPTETPRPTTIVWSWWRMTNNARRESIGLKPPTSMPTSSPRPSTVTVTSILQSMVTVTSIQPSAVTVTATSTVTDGPVDASTSSQSQLRQKNVKKKLKTFNGLTHFMQILTGLLG